jgi:hypothetical protein
LNHLVHEHIISVEFCYQSAMHKMARKLSSFKVYYCFRKQWHPNLLEQILEMSRNCGFCTTGDGAFTCPRCNKDYCGLKCYQSINHQRCSEDFYKECVKAELGKHIYQLFYHSKNSKKFLMVLIFEEKSFHVF